MYRQEQEEGDIKSENGKEDLKSLRVAVGEVFADLLKSASVQVKDEEWGGESVDKIEGAIPDKSIVKAVKLGTPEEKV